MSALLYILPLSLMPFVDLDLSPRQLVIFPIRLGGEEREQSRRMSLGTRHRKLRTGLSIRRIATFPNGLGGCVREANKTNETNRTNESNEANGSASHFSLFLILS